MQSVNEYYSAVQLRADRWSVLAREPGERWLARPRRAAPSDCASGSTQLFDALTVIEPYWAFPGMAAFDHLRRQFEHGNLSDGLRHAAGHPRADLGRLPPAAHPARARLADNDDHEDEALLSPEARALSKPYFEVLIVDDVNEHQERWLKANVTRMRRPEDPFIYEAVVVPSIEDALIAVLFNHNIQAIVVRPGLSLKSKTELPILTRYLNRAGGAEGIEALAPEDYGPEPAA
jgi:arginine decarboxylase